MARAVFILEASGNAGGKELAQEVDNRGGEIREAGGPLRCVWWGSRMSRF